MPGDALFYLFLIVACGAWIGSFRLGGVSLGAAGVFFVGLIFGHFRVTIPPQVTELGLVLFVYALGLQVGSRFFSLFRRSALQYLLVGAVATGCAAATALALGWLLGLSPSLAAGLLCGATTCTPALAGVLDLARRIDADTAAMAAVGYGVAYPVSIVSTVMAVQWLPRWTGQAAAAAAERFAAQQAESAPEPEVIAFRVSNPNCVGLTISEFGQLHLAAVVISRVKHDGAVHAARPETRLRMHDVVLAIGPPQELAKLETVLGDVVVEAMDDPKGDVVSRRVQVSHRRAIGKSLRELGAWQRGVVVTRVWREGLQFTPHGDVALEAGDVLRVVGDSAAVSAFAADVGREERRLDETSLVPFAAGLAAGLLLGAVSLPVAGMHARLGAAGGVFVTALVLGHLGRIGPMRLYVPTPARHIVRDLGLVIFMVGAGLTAGENFAAVLATAGPRLVLAGAVVTAIALAVSIGILCVALRWNVLSSGGAVAAVMTNPAALNEASRLADSDAPILAFASVYPVALIAKILLAQLVYGLLG